MCVGTARLLPDEASDLVAGITKALAALANTGLDLDDQAVGKRLGSVETRVALLELRDET